MSILTSQIKEVLNGAIAELKLSGEVIVEKAKNNVNGHFTTNFPLINAKKIGENPMVLAEKLMDLLQANPLFAKIEVAKPGFINFYLADKELQAILKMVQTKKTTFGQGEKKNFKYNLELVSANPTGFLHIGHARNGVIGDSVARILKFNGYDVETEYYTNDAGNQINVLACTMYYNYLKELGKEVAEPAEMYGGTIYAEVVKKFIDEYGDRFVGHTMADNRISDPEVHELFREKSIQYFLVEIKKQLDELGVAIGYYSSEKAMYDNHEIEKTLKLYEELGKTYQLDGALWLKTTEFGDDKDRVLVKSDGTYTYITPDLACHNIRFNRAKANKYVNYWGGDHHGYITRVRAGLALLGNDFNALDIEMIQMVRLIKNGQEYKMSKRRGTAVWLVDLLEMIGKDSIRYMLASKAPSTHMDFDLDLAVAKNSANPVYYAQYATARASKLITKAAELKLESDKFDLLVAPKEKELMILLDNFVDQVVYAGKSRLPSVICDYIQTLAKAFHSYYSDAPIIDESNRALSGQRINLVKAIRQVLSNAFALIDIAVIEHM
jgi:arginyl-tRNA synthetase